MGKNNEIQKCSNIDLSKLPPCKRSLVPHCRRVNYRAAQFKCAHLNCPDPPKGHGWIPTNETLLINDVASNEPVIEPVWSEGHILPDRLIDLVTGDNSGSDSDEEEDESDMTELDEYEAGFQDIVRSD